MREERLGETPRINLIGSEVKEAARDPGKALKKPCKCEDE
jgi:hypothetical protein